MPRTPGACVGWESPPALYMEQLGVSGGARPCPATYPRFESWCSAALRESTNASFQTTTSVSWPWNTRSHPLLAISQLLPLGGTQSSASLCGPAEGASFPRGRPGWGKNLLRTPEWAIGSCHSAPSPHQHPITSLPLSALLQVFPMGSETSPESRFRTFPASCAVGHPVEEESRGVEAGGAGETLGWDRIVTFGMDF